MKQEFRIEIEAEGNKPAEDFLDTMKKVAEKAEYEHGIDVNVERIERTETNVDVDFERASQ